MKYGPPHLNGIFISPTSASVMPKHVSKVNRIFNRTVNDDGLDKYLFFRNYS